MESEETLQAEMVNPHQPDSSSAGLRNFGSILKWLISFIRLTDEEKNDAGIYLNNQRDG